MPDSPPVRQQGLELLPLSEGMDEVTNPVLPPSRAADRLAHFDPDLYDLSPESHLSRLMKVLLGDAGVNRLAKSNLLARFCQSLHGTNFFDLDAFYGAIFGAQRRLDERISGDPYSDIHTDEEWEEICLRDDSYRSRVEQFARAINYGATPTGLVLMAEALLRVDCDLYESFVTEDRKINSYGDLEGVGTYGSIEALGSYGNLESDGSAPDATYRRAVFTIVPKRIITDEEHYDLQRVLNVLKPSDSILRIKPGRPILKEVPILSAASDSEYWKIEKKRPDGSDLVSIPSPPFSSYQGEAWTHIESVSGVTSYQMTPQGEVLKWGLVGTVVSGQVKWTYTPDLALVPLDRIIEGRVVSDGVFVRHPFRGVAQRRVPFFFPLGDTPFYDLVEQIDPSVARTGFWADGYAILDPNQPILFGGHRRTAQQFWATPERLPSNPGSRVRYPEIWDVIEVRLSNQRLVNYISMELARFPHTATVQAYSEETGTWVTLRTWKILESFPERLSTNPTIRQDTHPQHNVQGHWTKCSDVVSAVRTDRLRIILNRFPGPGPLEQRSDGQRLRVPYSLAVKNWDVGYRIRGREDIPSPTESEGGGFATVLDAKGGTMVLDVRENPATNVLDSLPTIWKSEPQPTNRAVASLYLDVRSTTGKPQVIDTLYLDPARSGPHINLYWSVSDEMGPFDAKDDPVPYTTTGVVEADRDGALNFSASNSSYVTISNDDIQFDPSTEVDWWFAAKVKARAAAGTMDDFQVIWSDGQHLSLIMGLDPNDSETKVALVATNENDAIIGAIETPLGVVANETVVVQAWFDHATSQIGIAYEGTSGNGIARGNLYGEIPRPSEIKFGGLPWFPSANFSILGLFLKVGMAPDPISTVADDFESYLLKNRPGLTSQGLTDNALVRFSPRFSTSDRFGFVGGPAEAWDGRIWHPIERDYRLTSGYLKMPPVRTKFLKLEFTNLAPELVESMVPITRRVRLFPSQIGKIRNGPSPTQRPPARIPPGPRPRTPWTTTQGQAAAQSVRFADSPFVSGLSERVSMPTSARVMSDPTRTPWVRDTSWIYGMQEWQIGSDAPRFHEVGTHVYDEYEIKDSAKMGFFVALRSIRAYRTAYQVDDNTRAYRDRFFDDEMWVDGYTWELDPGLFTATFSGASATSKVFRSNHPVRAIQFATHQSDPLQTMPNHDFTDESMATLDWEDETTWHVVGDATATYLAQDYAVRVTRDTSSISDTGSPGSPLTGSSIMRRPVSEVFSFRYEEGTIIEAQAEGGLASPYVGTSPEGMIHAAVRATAITHVDGPLILQIIGADDSVLAEKQEYLRKGETKEWYVSHQLGIYSRGGFQLFEGPTLLDGGAPDMEQRGPMREVFSHVAPTPTGDVPAYAPDEIVRVRLIQRGGSTDTWKIDKMSLFDDAIVWEFSNDGGTNWVPALNIRNNPNGVLQFERPSNGLCWRVTSYQSNRTVSSIQVRPWYDRQFTAIAGVPHRGPNVSSFDQDPPITDDPEFQGWSKPVPKWWWREGELFPIRPGLNQPLTNPNSNVYARVLTENLDSITEDLTYVLDAERQVDEDLSAQTDAASTGPNTFSRTVTETLPPITERTKGFYLHEDAIMRPPLSPPPTTGD